MDFRILQLIKADPNNPLHISIKNQTLEILDKICYFGHPDNKDYYLIDKHLLDQVDKYLANNQDNLSISNRELISEDLLKLRNCLTNDSPAFYLNAK